MLELPRHPLERNTKCPVCSVDYKTIPLRRGHSPDDPSHVLEQHVCPNGHVYQTELGREEMLSDW